MDGKSTSEDQGGNATSPTASAREIRFHPAHVEAGGKLALHSERMYELLGTERSLRETTRILRHYVQDLHPPVVGALHVTCADEAEQECVDAFRRDFVQYMLPSQKFASKSCMRLANLGGRYEWGAVRIAESHFALAKGASDWKVVVLKLNAHVCVDDGDEVLRFGRMQRYDAEDDYCGALNALLDGAGLPFADDLTTSFLYDGVDRIEALRDAQRVAPDLRGLFAAVTSARLQARRAVLDVQDYRPKTPTLYLVLPCVSLNRPGHDTEIVCGLYTLDRRGDEAHDEYCGVDDRPWDYRLRHEGRALVVEDPDSRTPRLARDHRALVVQEWESQGHPRPATDPRLGQVLDHAVREGRHHHDPIHAKTVLRTALGVMLGAAPVPAAVLLFGAGLVDIHHAAQAYRLAREAEGDEVARRMLTEVEGRIDQLEPEQAQHLIELLVREYGS